MDMKVKVTQSSLTRSDPVDSMVHGIFQARILEWNTKSPFASPGDLPNQTKLSCIAGGFFISIATREAHEYET